MLDFDYIDSILYDSLGHTGNTYYIRIVGYNTGEIWNNVSLAMEDDPPWDESAIDLLETGVTGQFPIVIPADLPSGRYDIIAYVRTGSEPANTDDVEKQITITKGSIFGF